MKREIATGSEDPGAIVTTHERHVRCSNHGNLGPGMMCPPMRSDKTLFRNHHVAGLFAEQESATAVGEAFALAMRTSSSPPRSSREEAVKALRGPSYLRIAGANRDGVVQVPLASQAMPSAPERKTGRHEDAVRKQLTRWKAPVLSDEEIETYAKLFLMKPGHELMPFFLWIDDATRAAHAR